MQEKFAHVGAVTMLVGVLGLLAYISDQSAVPLSRFNVAAVLASRLVELTNVDRVSTGGTTLTVSPLLTNVAQLKADDMVAKGYFAHYAPQGTSPWHWFDAAGYRYLYAGENLAVFFNESEEVENAWMKSPSHRANITNPHFIEVGIALARGTYKGQAVTFVVEEFGTPQSTHSQ